MKIRRAASIPWYFAPLSLIGQNLRGLPINPVAFVLTRKPFLAQFRRLELQIFDVARHSVVQTSILFDCIHLFSLVDIQMFHAGKDDSGRLPHLPPNQRRNTSSTLYGAATEGRNLDVKLTDKPFGAHSHLFRAVVENFPELRAIATQPRTRTHVTPLGPSRPHLYNYSFLVATKCVTRTS